MPELDPAFLRAPIAHRGLHGASRVENGRAAVEAAAAAGYGIEIDVQRAACGEAMVFHDDALARLISLPGRLREHPAAELGRMRLAGSDETIPTLADILALTGGRVPLLIEVKDQDGSLGPAVGPLETRVANLLADYRGPVAVMSFNPHSVAALARAAPAVARGLATCDFLDPHWRLDEARRRELAGLADFDAVGACFVSHDRRDLGNPALAQLKARGVPILSWTVRSPQEEAAARTAADNVTFEGYAAAIDAAAKPAL